MVTIPRHTVDQAALDAALHGFDKRMNEHVDTMVQAGREFASWDWVAETALSYVGARSVEDSEFLSRETGMALRAAAEVALGHLEVKWRAESEPVDVFVSYLNRGVVHEWHEERAPSNQRGQAPMWAWFEAFRLCVLCLPEDAQVADVLRESLRTLPNPAEMPPGPDRAAIALARALEELSRPEPDEQRVSAVLAHAEESSEHLALQVTAVRSLVQRDAEAFHSALEALVRLHHQQRSSSVDPAGMLDYRALVLASLAHRRGVPVRVESDYLPTRLYTGQCWEAPDKRAEAFGVSLVPLPAAGLEIPRNELDIETGRFDMFTRKHIDSLLESQAPGILGMVVNWQQLRLCERSLLDPQANDVRQWHAIALMAQAGGAAARALRTPREETLEIQLGTAGGPVKGGHGTEVLNYREFVAAMSAALTARDTAALGELAELDEESVAGTIRRPSDAWYLRALLRFMRGDDFSEATEKGLAAVKQLQPGSPPAHFVQGRVVGPLMLLSQLAAGNAEAFALSLADALETWTTYWSLPDQKGDLEQLVATPLLGLAAVAHDRGWNIPVTSEYLPKHLLEGSWVGAPVDVDAPTEAEAPTPYTGVGVNAE